MLELWGVMISTFGKTWRTDLDACTTSSELFHREMIDRLSELQFSRYVYTALVRTLFRLLSALWSPESVRKENAYLRLNKNQGNISTF